MLQELAARTGAQAWAIASMLFFLLAFLTVAALAWHTEPTWAERCARLPLTSDDPPEGGNRDAQGAASPQTL
ncbi:MAG: hypothetical protein WDA75_13740 [Candidatus Latescibacterota bacterium]